MKVSKRLFAQLGLPKAETHWVAIVKLVIARFVRGNIPAQFASILLPSEQRAQRLEAEEVAAAWEAEFQRSKS